MVLETLAGCNGCVDPLTISLGNRWAGLLGEARGSRGDVAELKALRAVLSRRRPLSL